MRAKLLNPVWLTISPINRAGTRTDPDREEPRLLVARSASVEIQAQLDLINANSRRPTEGGGQVDAVAEATILTADMRRLTYTPSDGDRVVQVRYRNATTKAVAWYVGEHHNDGQEREGDKLVVLTLTTQAPSRTSIEGSG